MLVQPGLDTRGHERRENEQAPHAVDDAGMAASSSTASDRGAQQRRRNVGQKQGDADATGTASSSAKIEVTSVP